MTTKNFNPAVGSSFLLELPNNPGINYFVQTAEVPGLTMGGIDTPYKNHQGVQPSNRIDFDPLNVTFLVDENWNNWWSLLLWMYKIRTGKVSINDEMVDITLHLVNTNKNLNKRLKFFGAFPTMVSSMQLDSTNIESNVLVCSATFRYQYYEMIEAT